ncbi:MAG: hypothetical protein AMS22_06110 [Thiotrichales bacterium SG8_50]|nr:MAG: hypothetical protein AMS22_06110 [Thiotrichales bacterium SG8_50]
MSTDLIPFDASALPTTELVTAEQMDELSKGVDYLQRLQLITKGKYVDTGKIKPGHYGIPLPGGEEIDDLGSSIDILPLAVRAKALDMSDREAVVAVYDMSTPEFQDIKARSGEQDSGCMWGPSFLVVERSTGRCFEFFMGTKSSRAVSGDLINFLPVSEATAAKQGIDAHGPLPCTLTVRYAKRGSWGWHVPVVNKCSEPFTKTPSLDVLREEMRKFIEVKDNGVQNVTEAETAAAKRRAR